MNNLYKNTDGDIYGFDAWQTVPEGMTKLTQKEYDAHVNPAPTPSHMQADLEAKVQELLDSQARSMNFDNILSGISNASLPIGEYRQTDGAALLLWRARVWEKAAEIRDAFLAGQRAVPTWEEVETELPSYHVVA